MICDRWLQYQTSRLTPSWFPAPACSSVVFENSLVPIEDENNLRKTRELGAHEARGPCDAEVT